MIGVVLAVIVLNIGAACADVITDDTDETEQLPVVDDNENDLELPGHRSRLKVLAVTLARTAEVVKRIFDQTTAFIREPRQISLAQTESLVLLSTLPDGPFRPPPL